jgi:hypothetical protein
MAVAVPRILIGVHARVADTLLLMIVCYSHAGAGGAVRAGRCWSLGVFPILNRTTGSVVPLKHLGQKLTHLRPAFTSLNLSLPQARWRFRRWCDQSFTLFRAGDSGNLTPAGLNPAISPRKCGLLRGCGQQALVVQMKVWGVAGRGRGGQWHHAGQSP